MLENILANLLGDIKKVSNFAPNKIVLLSSLLTITTRN